MTEVLSFGCCPLCQQEGREIGQYMYSGLTSYFCPNCEMYYTDRAGGKTRRVKA